MMREILENSAVAGHEEAFIAKSALEVNRWDSKKVLSLCDFLISKDSEGITGKLISAEWDKWSEWPQHINELKDSDLYTLRRITGRDRSQSWGDM
jgi:3-oxoacyl-[acyl-carrier protein] reductase